MSDQKQEKISVNPQFDRMNQVGLNVVGVMNLSCLWKENKQRLDNSSMDISKYTQIIVVGHLGNTLWESLPKNYWQSEDPIDQFARDQVVTFFDAALGREEYQILFPTIDDTKLTLGLQSLGEQLGWHYPSPFRIGINEQWGSWFAYRAVVLANSHYPVSNFKSTHPCLSCSDKPCISSCPAGALDAGDLSLSKCIDYRASPNSQCADRCLARMACPVAKTKQYSLKQIQYHYGQSLNTIKRFKDL